MFRMKPLAGPPEGVDNRAMESLKKNLSFVSIAAGLALALSACGEDGDQTQAPEEPTQTQTTMETPGASPGASPATSPGGSPGATGGTGSPIAGVQRDARAAVATAVAAVNGSTAIELDFSDSRQEWEVELVSADTEHEVRVSPDGSEVLEQKEGGAADEEDRSELEGMTVTLAKAIETAQQEAAGQVQEASLESENDKPVWEVEIRAEDGKSTEIQIDAKTGEPVR